MDRYRLVMPPTLFIVLATPFWYLSHTLFFYNWHAALAVFCGGVFGYVCYDLTHYFLHHKKWVGSVLVISPNIGCILSNFIGFSLTRCPAYHIITESLKNIISNTTLQTTRTVTVLRAGFGIEFSKQSLKCLLPRSLRRLNFVLLINVLM